jgi:uncharacterized protein (TIGR02246 family)
MPSTDEHVVRALYERLMSGWNEGSGAAFAAPLAADVDFVAFDGSAFQGREAITAFHDPLFRTHLRGTRLVGEVTSVRFLSPTVALMHARGSTIMRGEAHASPARDSIQTLVAVKADGTWSLSAFQNTRVRPIGQGVAGTLLWLIGDWLWKLALGRTPAEPGRRAPGLMPRITRPGH